MPQSPASSALSSISLLEKAAQHQRERAATYDQPGGERSMGRTVAAFNIITGREGDRALSESEGWLLMQVLKDVRDRARTAPHQDSLEDGIAYSSLKAEARLAEFTNQGVAAYVAERQVKRPCTCDVIPGSGFCANDGGALEGNYCKATGTIGA